MGRDCEHLINMLILASTKACDKCQRMKCKSRLVYERVFSNENILIPRLANAPVPVNVYIYSRGDKSRQPLGSSVLSSIDVDGLSIAGDAGQH